MQVFPLRTRFAPSPTGRLHLGHILAARVARAVAGPEKGGSFLLRHEDIDVTRVREEYFQPIEEDLKWLGLTWEKPSSRQTGRIPAHEEALQELKNTGVLYPCFCTRRDIQMEQARLAGAPHESPAAIYPGICRNLSQQVRQEKIAAGIPHAWRLDAGRAVELAGPLDFQDLRFGLTQVNPGALGDVVLARKDIGIAYHLAVVVDDAFQQITHVTRGEDLLESTHVHRLLQALLRLPQPVYLHHGLMRDSDGKRLAKRHHSLSIHFLRSSGMTPAELLALTEEEFQIALKAFQKTR